MRRQRRSIRLPGFDYRTAGAYFVTVCTFRRRCLLGHIREDVMHLSPIGELVSRAWREIPAHHPVMHIDAFVVMPNHVHGILFREEAVGAKHASPLHRPGTVSGSLPAVVQSFKSAASRFAAATGETSGARLWQRGFHEHVLRTEADLARLRRYIMENPLRWALDRENPDREES